MSHLQISLTKAQAEFIQLQEKVLYSLFNGGFGSGKSHVMAVSAFLDSLHSPEAWVTLYEPLYSHILDIAMPYMIKLLEENNIGYERNKDEKIIWTHSNQIGNFRFRSMDNPDTIVGYETYTSHVDELDTLPKDKADKVWNMILGRCRQWPKGVPHKFMQLNEITGKMEPRNKVCAYSTPEGFNYTYETWYKNRLKKERGLSDYRPEYDFIQCKTEDNPFVSQAYVDNLRSKYPEKLIDAYLNGEWVNLESGSVYYAYNEQAHDTDEEILKGEPLHIGFDYNVRDMSAVVHVVRDKSLHAVMEYTGILDAPRLISSIERDFVLKGHNIYAYPDRSGMNKNAGNYDQPYEKYLKDAGFKIVNRALKKNMDVVDRYTITNNAFEQGKYFVSVDRCPNYSEALSHQPFNDKGDPEKGTGYDNIIDAGTYCASWFFRPRKNAGQILYFDSARRA